VPVKSGERPELPVGGHSTQCVPPPVPEERPAVPAELVAVRPPPPPPPADPDPDTAPPAAAADAPAAVAAVPEADNAGRAIAPPAAG